MSRPCNAAIATAGDPPETCFSSPMAVHATLPGGRLRNRPTLSRVGSRPDPRRRRPPSPPCRALLRSPMGRFNGRRPQRSLGTNTFTFTEDARRPASETGPSLDRSGPLRTPRGRFWVRPGRRPRVGMVTHVTRSVYGAPVNRQGGDARRVDEAISLERYHIDY